MREAGLAMVDTLPVSCCCVTCLFVSPEGSRTGTTFPGIGKEKGR